MATNRTTSKARIEVTTSIGPGIAHGLDALIMDLAFKSGGY